MKPDSYYRNLFRQAKRDIERINWETTQEYEIQKTVSTKPIKGAQGQAMDGKLYVCGGYNGEHDPSSCESYDPVTKASWESMPNMMRAKSYAAAICFGGKIYITGGFIKKEEKPIFLESKQWKGNWRWTSTDYCSSAISTK